MHTDDGRYIVVNGRRWRATDPSIPGDLRQVLVDVLMAARRDVYRFRDDAESVAAARRRVDDAKRALGERGPAWWDPPDQDAQRVRAEAAVRALASSSSFARPVTATDVAQIVGGGDWRDVLPLAETVLEEV